MLEIGTIVRAHGIRGEVVVEAVSNRPERFAPGAELFSPNGDPFLIRTVTRQGGPDAVGRPTRARWIVGFEGVATRNEAERLRGTRLFGEPLGEPGEDEVWVHELIGAEVVDVGGRSLGRVAAVEANPASDLIVLEAGGLVPMVFVVETTPGRVVVDPPAGLLDV